MFAGDTIIYRGVNAGRVWYVLEVGGVVYVAVAKFVLDGAPAIYTCTYTTTENVVLVALSDVTAVVIQMTVANKATVLIPNGVRSSALI